MPRVTRKMEMPLRSDFTQTRTKFGRFPMYLLTQQTKVLRVSFQEKKTQVRVRCKATHRVHNVRVR